MLPVNTSFVSGASEWVLSVKTIPKNILIKSPIWKNESIIILKKETFESAFETRKRWPKKERLKKIKDMAINIKNTPSFRKKRFPDTEPILEKGKIE